MIENKVKLIIWDLDETFWKGTLAEEGMTPIEGNAEKIVELSKRGIVNSICSKNDFEQAKAKLVELGAWDYFVFPVISFNPKGKAVAEMIESAALRAENVLFIDDNPMNLEEVKHFNPGIMARHPKDVLEGLLDHPNLVGKPDPELTRLKQYRFLQRKVEERSTSSVSNEEFLRLSNIRVTIDYDVEANFDRVVELINRTNQLNYTKERLEDPVSLKRFRAKLTAHGHNSGCVWVKDNYGDYGLVGFFMMVRRPSKKKLIHFVFSCRTMNMGIEQYVYEMLNKPEIKIVEPVSYGLEPHAAIDWINAGDGDGASGGAKGGKLVLLGGCDMLQLANYCSTNRVEFANRSVGNSQVRYDDVYFILNDRETLRKSADKLPTWSYADAIEFDESVAGADLILLCLFGAANADYYEVDGAVRMRLFEEFLTDENLGAVGDRAKLLDLDIEARAQLLIACFDRVAQLIRKDAQVFVIGYPTLNTKNEKKLAKRKAVNQAQKENLAGRPQFTFLDVDELLPHAELLDQRHYSPAGYFLLARHILRTSGISGPVLDMDKDRKDSAKARVPADAEVA